MGAGVLVISNLVEQNRPQTAHFEETISDEDLFVLVAKGNNIAFRHLVDRHLARVISIATRMLNDPSAADDIAQEAMVRVWSQGSLWRPGTAKFTTWLHRVVVNLCIDRLRKRKFAPLDQAEMIPHPHANPAQDVHETEIKNIVQNALNGLPGKQKAAIILCHYQGYSGKEAAAILNISVLAVQSLLVRARTTLKHDLAAYADEIGESL